MQPCLEPSAGCRLGAAAAARLPRPHAFALPIPHDGPAQARVAGKWPPEAFKNGCLRCMSLRQCASQSVLPPCCPLLLAAADAPTDAVSSWACPRRLLAAPRLGRGTDAVKPKPEGRGALRVARGRVLAAVEEGVLYVPLGAGRSRPRRIGSLTHRTDKRGREGGRASLPFLSAAG